MVEIGADLAVDVVVTEPAPPGALRLRLAALGRAGHRRPPGRAVVVSCGPGSTGPGGVVCDGGVCDGTVCDGGVADGTVPLVLGPVLDAWAATSPVPVPDPPLDAYLHGFGFPAGTVILAWRDGLLDGDGHPVPAAVAEVMLRALPVQPEEQVEVPLDEVRARR